MSLKVIHKFVVAPGEFQLPLRAFAETLCVQVDQKDGRPRVWVLYDDDAQPMVRTFRAVGTGEPLRGSFMRDVEVANGAWRYVGTWQASGYVWHLFELLE